MRAAATSLPPTRAQVRSISPHPGGVAVHLHPGDSTMDHLDRRMRLALRQHGLPMLAPAHRDLWYCNIVHFAAPVDVAGLLAWADARRDLVLGSTEVATMELVRYEFTGAAMRAVTVHEQPLADLSGHAASFGAVSPG
jgi:hypothetical protein